MDELWLRFITSLVAGGFFLVSFLFIPWLFCVLLVAVSALILFWEFPRLVPVRTWKFWLLLPFYPLLPLVCLFHLFFMYYASNWLIPLYPFLVAWTFDCGAYFIGSLLGYHKIAPRISPGKSWEGSLGGFVSVYVLNTVMVAKTHGFVFTIVISLLLSLLAFWGDLFESYLKRAAGLKDTGHLLPGHGGVLDRFDSVLFVAVAVSFYFLSGEWFARDLGKILFIGS